LEIPFFGRDSHYSSVAAPILTSWSMGRGSLEGSRENGVSDFVSSLAYRNQLSGKTFAEMCMEFLPMPRRRCLVVVGTLQGILDEVDVSHLIARGCGIFQGCMED
jgi:hypothetical protein